MLSTNINGLKKFSILYSRDLILYITGLNSFCFMRTNYLNRNTTIKTANCAKKWYNDKVI